MTISVEIAGIAKPSLLSFLVLRALPLPTHSRALFPSLLTALHFYAPSSFLLTSC